MAADEQPTAATMRTVREHGARTVEMNHPGPAFERFVAERWAGLSGEARMLALDAFIEGGCAFGEGLAAIYELEPSSALERELAREIREMGEARRRVR